ncbi:MAG: glycosyltransferase family 4 protein [Alphaproteobacteria bacterium]
MRILLATDAWFPQVNGVVRTLDTVRRELLALGHDVLVVAPDRFKTIPCPSYPEIRLAFGVLPRLRKLIAEFQPEAVHIATEGPIGWAVRRFCLRRGWPFTTAFHTKFPEYVHARWRVPVGWSYALMRRFHRPSSGIMVATESLAKELSARGFENIRAWTRGVDTELFRPRAKGWLGADRPIFMFVGRVAVEKNIEAFLALDLPGTKFVVGDGPQLESLRAKYRAVRFTGYRQGEELAATLAEADVFVFPSLTDTFGLVLLEALASGVPVAAFPVTGPIDVVLDGKVGALDTDLRRAALEALQKSPDACRAYALGYSWRRCAEIFLGHLRPFGQPATDHQRKISAPSFTS